MGNDLFKKQLAQLFMVGFSGAELEEQLEELLVRHRFTSFIVFRKNLEGGRGIGHLVDDARARARSLGLPDLLFAADEEGGLISPLGEEVGRLPSPMALAAGGFTERIREVATMVGEGIADLGIHLVLAPVLDVNSNPSNPVIGTRSFGDDPDAVARMGSALLDGFTSAGLLCCVKHFPGHGNTSADSHKTLPVVSSSAAQLSATDLVPFRRVLERRVDAIMTAHVAYPAIDDGALRPSTISSRIQTELLRSEMGFRGALLSDSMEMLGLAESMPPERACIEGLKAGVDLFICVDPFLAGRCLEELEREIDSGALDPEAAKRAIARVVRLKQKAGGGGPRQGRGERREAGRPDGVELTDSARIVERIVSLTRALEKCYESSLTLLGCESHELKERLRAINRGLLVIPDGLHGYEELNLALLEGHLKDLEVADKWSILSYPYDPGSEEIGVLLSQAAAAEGLILCTLGRGPEPAGQRRLASALLKAGNLMAGVALLDPYGLARLFPPELPGLATYGYWPDCLRALARLLFGRASATGVLPIDIKRAKC